MKIANKMNRKGLLAVIFCLMMNLSSIGQVFVLDGDNNRNTTENTNIGNLSLPEINSGSDQFYTPIGNGLWLLLALGGAYLVRKRIYGDEI